LWTRATWQNSSHHRLYCLNYKETYCYDSSPDKRASGVRNDVKITLASKSLLSGWRLLVLQVFNLYLCGVSVGCAHIIQTGLLPLNYNFSQVPRGIALITSSNVYTCSSILMACVLVAIICTLSWAKFLRMKFFTLHKHQSINIANTLQLLRFSKTCHKCKGTVVMLHTRKFWCKRINFFICLKFGKEQAFIFHQHLIRQIFLRQDFLAQITVFSYPLQGVHANTDSFWS